MNGVAASATGSAGAAITRLPAPARGCELWLCSLDDDTHAAVAMAASLSVPECARAARFGTELLRRRFSLNLPRRFST